MDLSISTSAETRPRLELTNVTAGYGGADVIHNVSLSVLPGEVLAVIGRNGVGKTTLLRAIMGQAHVRQGSVALDGRPIDRYSTYRRARSGLGYVPQGRRIFPSLTGRENLAVAGYGSRRRNWKESRDAVLGYFPTLGDYLGQRGLQLSGGQQQLLALARAMITKPRGLLLDEPSEGIQPNIVAQIATTISMLRSRFNLAVIVVEQNLGFLEKFADRTLIMDNGRIVTETTISAVRADPDLTSTFLGF